MDKTRSRDENDEGKAIEAKRQRMHGLERSKGASLQITKEMYDRDKDGIWKEIVDKKPFIVGGHWSEQMQGNRRRFCRALSPSI